jgi:CMP/dCMP kinase
MSTAVSARPRPIIAIDGPAGAGKSTLARSLAERLGFLLVDTGAMYRAIALAAQRAGVPWTEAERLGALGQTLVQERSVSFVPDAGRGVRVYLHGEDVSDAIRTPDIAMGASTVSAHGPVRAALLDLQRQAGEGGGVVLEGRDIGTVVFPDAEVKIFLTAAPEVRAARRHAELTQKGQDVTFEATLADVLARDAQDTGRAVAPLRQAEGAILVDSSALDFDSTLARMVSIAQGSSA